MLGGDVAEVPEPDHAPTPGCSSRARRTIRARRPATISHATIGGVIALPSRANACVSPCAKPRRPTGVQLCIARVATGNVAPSPMPTSTRQKNSDDQAAGRSRSGSSPSPRPGRTGTASGAGRSDRRSSRRRSGRSGRDSRTPTARSRAGVLREPQLLLDRVGGRRDVDAIDVRDQVHHAEQAEDDGGRLRPLDEGHSRGYRLHQ